jgi:hypothetical protein
MSSCSAWLPNGAPTPGDGTRNATWRRRGTLTATPCAADSSARATAACTTTADAPSRSPLRCRSPTWRRSVRPDFEHRRREPEAAGKLCDAEYASIGAGNTCAALDRNSTVAASRTLANG